MSKNEDKKLTYAAQGVYWATPSDGKRRRQSNDAAQVDDTRLTQKGTSSGSEKQGQLKKHKAQGIIMQAGRINRPNHLTSRIHLTALPMVAR
jgi:hypothetical protein